MPRPYREIRKDYILARADSILLSSAGRLSRQDAKEVACGEFDEMVRHEREKATAEIREERDRLRTELVTQQALDTSSSTSVQHYIDTGHYLPALPKNTNDFANDLPSEIFDVLMERDDTNEDSDDSARRAAEWVRENENDAVWDRFIYPMLQRIEKEIAS